MAKSLSMSVPGNLGTNAGPASDGVLIGQLTQTDPTAVLIKGGVSAGLAYTDDGGVYVDDTTDWGDAGADDVAPWPATPAVDDAFYIGHATTTFATITIEIGTAGSGTWTAAWEYWNGSAWTAVDTLVDGTTAWEAAAGSVDVTHVPQSDWAKCTIDGVNGYWVRSRVATYSAVVTQCTLDFGFVTTTAAVWSDETTDFTDAGAADVAIIGSLNAVVDDGAYIGHTEKFCKIETNVSTARTGTATVTAKYWDGSAWTALATVDDDSTGWSTGTSTYFTSFVPPSDWVANTAANGPNGQTGFWISMTLTAITSITALPVVTQGWIYPMKTGASGIDSPIKATSAKLAMSAQTASATNADTTLLLVNTATGASAGYVWTKADPFVEATGTIAINLGAGLALVQVTEDGTTEFADASITVTL